MTPLPVDASIRKARHIVCRSIFLILLATYWLTTPSTVSYWDCPEYVSAAYLLEIGHPPGNPFWMLVERVITMLVPAMYAAYAINLSSGLFTALAGYFLASIVFTIALWILHGRHSRHEIPYAAGAAAMAALVFGWCDSTWYSAVEAEVYAMSIFFTALSVWLMVKWAFMRDRLKANRTLVLIAYVFGLSIGVHQLNLLAIPALALIWGMRRGIRSPLRLIGVVVAGMAAVGVILLFVMPYSIYAAAGLELKLVNGLGLPPLSGVVAFLLLLGGALLLALFLSVRYRKRRLALAFWMVAMLLVGYGSYAIIPLRGNIPSPANPSMPGEPFAFAAYQNREQYGAKPLFYGQTPFSQPLFQEEWDSVAGRHVYRKYALRPVHRTYLPASEAGDIRLDNSRIAPEDTAANARLIRSGRPGYLVSGSRFVNIYTPELNAFLPRITSRDPADLSSYYDWAGMDTSNMRRVAVSQALDSLGRPVAMYRPDGKRDTVWSYKPTLAQHLRMLGTYQISYMYLRYLMWNFAGRQNDVPSQGEVEHGNFISGFTPVDNAMLGAEDSLPSDIGSSNPGRNRYFFLPFAFGILGLVWLFRINRRGQATGGVSLLLFFMTGIAIVIYLNQDPGEPRERDYSFIGSFWAYALWTGFGALWAAKAFKTPWAYALTFLVPVWMCMENYDDHDRRGREAARNIAVATLEELEPEAILFVDGDNFTFPLWYAQEVEGIRTDVRVINAAYLSQPRYAANLLRRWRDSPALPSAFRAEDIIGGAFSWSRVGAGGHDTLPAIDVIRSLRESPDARTPALYARIPVAAGDTLVYDLRGLSPSGASFDIPFHQLMIFNFLASNAASAHPRPVYWSSMLTDAKRLHMPEDAMSEGLQVWKWGKQPEAATLKLLAGSVDKVGAPNSLNRKVYMDATPARMTGSLRNRLVKSAGRLLDHGMLREAGTALYKADILMGDNPQSYIYLSRGDSVINGQQLLGLEQLRLADSLAARQSGRHAEAKILELRARGRHNIGSANRRIRAWQHYRGALPPHLRGLTAPLR